MARRAARAAAVAAAERAVAAAAVAAVGAADAPPASPLYSGAEGHASLLAEVRVAHEAACTSVYWQTSADRCDALAVALTQRVRYVAVSPPSPPPAAPDVLAPPPPSAPPSPPLPAGVTEAAVAGVVPGAARPVHL